MAAMAHPVDCTSAGPILRAQHCCLSPNGGFRKVEKLCRRQESQDHRILKQEYMLPKLQIYKGNVLHFGPVKDHLTQQITCSQKQVKEIRKKMYAVTRNANKKLRRREVIIAQ